VEAGRRVLHIPIVVTVAPELTLLPWLGKRKLSWLPPPLSQPQGPF
jgi:hypothetical protein